MKEIKPGLERLTSYPHASTLRSERSFMAEQREIPGDSPKPIISKEIAQEFWGPKLESTKDPAEAATYRILIDRGIVPPEYKKIQTFEKKTGERWENLGPEQQRRYLRSGEIPGPGATERKGTGINRDDFTDARLKQVINIFNSGYAAREGKSRARFIENQINIVNNQILSASVNTNEAQRLLNYLDQLLINEPSEEEALANLFGGEARESAQIMELRRLLNIPAIRDEFKKDKPDFTLDALEPLRNFINGLDISNTRTYHEIARVVSGLKTENHGGTRDDREVSEKSRRLLFEWLYEKVIGRPDRLSEQAHYKIGSFQLLTLLDELDTLTAREFKDEFSTYLSELQHVREVMHNLNIALKYGDQYKKFILTDLSSHGLSFVHNELAGVNQVISAYEKFAAGKVADKKEWFNQGDVEEINGEVKRIFQSGMVSMQRDERKLMDWERDRAVRLGRILFAGTQRMALYAAFGDLPPMAATPDRIASLPYEYITRSLMNLKVIAVRFFAGDKEAPKKFMEMILGEWGKIQKDKEGNPEADKYVRLFGLDRRTIILNHSQSYDPQSHSWRMVEMFFDPVRFIQNGKENSLYEYINGLIKNYDAVSEDPLLGAVNLKDEDKKDISEKVRDIVLGQRLYLSVFPRYGNFSNELKQEIWKKVALLKPSTIASLMPLGMSEAEEGVWKGLRLKLYAAELKRVAEDGEKYQKPRSIDELKAEREAFEKTLKITSSATWTSGQFKEILNYMGMKDLSVNADEQKLIEKIIKHGINKSKDLATASLPYTLAIDDAPTVAWTKTGFGNGGLSDADVIRLLASDQEAISEGWGAINGFIENPTHGAIEAIQKAVDKIGGVHGRSNAQGAIEPFIIAYLKFVSTDPDVLWTPGKKTMARMVNKATSEIERYYRNSYLSMDEQAKRDFLQALSQAGAISDNITKKDQKGQAITQLDKIRKETKSSQAWMILFWMRTIIFLLGPVAGKEFIKLLMPAFSFK